MKRLLILPFAFIVLLALCAGPAWAQSGVPKEINFQGKLTDSNGDPVTVSISVTFAIYNTSTGGTALFTETQSVIPNARGIYSVRIGSVTSGGINLPFNEPYYLGVQVGTDAEMAPRYAMVAAPYALRAAVATNIDGLAVTSAELNQFAGINASVTAAALNTVTGGSTSDADAYHTHGYVANADQVDNFHAYPDSTPTAGHLLALDATGKFPVGVITQGASSTLDADLLDGQEGTYYQNATNINAGTLADARLSTNVPLLNAANAFSSQQTVTVATGTAPFAITSTTMVANLNADMVDGANAGNASGDVGLANGTLCTNLNADMVDGQHASSFATSTHSHAGGSWTYATSGTPTLTLAHTATTATSHALSATSAAASSAGVYGVTTNASGYGVYGYSTAAGARAVYGYATSTSTSPVSYGVYGYGLRGGYFRSFSSTTSANRAIEIGPSYYGIYVPSSTCTYGVYSYGSSYGGYFRGGSYGIYAYGTSYGVYGNGSTYGVYGYVSGSSDRGVYGRNSYSSSGYGVYGQGYYGGYFTGYYYSGYFSTSYSTSTRSVHGLYNYVYSSNSSNTYSSYGLYNYSSGYTGLAYGIYNRLYGTRTSTAYAAYNYNGASTSSTRYGSYNYAPTYAGYFSGNAYVTGTLTKGGGSFVQPHPTDATKEINYRFFEGPEDAIYERGVATLQNGRAVIDMPEHFRIVAKETDISVQLTPRSADSKGLALVSVTREKIEVRELDGGTGSYEFDYFVTGLRAGYEPHQPIQPNKHFRPDAHATIQDFEDGYTRVDGEDAAVAKRLMIQNGLMNPDGTLNRQKVLELGWRLPPDRNDDPEPDPTENDEEPEEPPAEEG